MVLSGDSSDAVVPWGGAVTSAGQGSQGSVLGGAGEVTSTDPSAVLAVFTAAFGSGVTVASSEPPGAPHPAANTNGSSNDETVNRYRMALLSVGHQCNRTGRAAPAKAARAIVMSAAPRDTDAAN